ncbi:hypothetical protein PsYK624_050480 [Phanerochaete sordida]|uniref:Extracellular membrane protein CFEM domain-containing protein n=1 Tax=Phanerochaete sordida TaxID=48140 RepID=A0A9P3LB82_9APHY|nr:hypothetical protein PsYK624_050480 [Phanerochaete sordida]
MQLFAIYTALFALLAGRVLALDALSLNISIMAGGLTVIPASQFLNTKDATLLSDCNSSCGPAQTTITACTDEDTACLCSNTTVAAVYSCEECMFTQLIKDNRAMPDVLAGNQVALTAYLTACQSVNTTVNGQMTMIPANFTYPKNLTALTLPTDWNGPAGSDLSVAATAITLIAALIVAGGAFSVVNTM